MDKKLNESFIYYKHIIDNLYIIMSHEHIIGDNDIFKYKLKEGKEGEALDVSKCLPFFHITHGAGDTYCEACTYCKHTTDCEKLTVLSFDNVFILLKDYSCKDCKVSYGKD